MKTASTKQVSYVRRRIELPVQQVSHQHPKNTWLQPLHQYILQQAAGENRFKWVGFIMAVQAIVITPLIAFIITVTGNWMPLWYAATATMYASFIPILSGLPVKPVMTVFFSNLAVQAMIIITALGYALFN